VTARPGHQRAPAVGRQRAAHDGLAGGRHHRGTRPGGAERADVDPAPVDRHGRDRAPGPVDDRAVERQAGVLHGDCGSAGRGERPDEQAEGVVGAAAHDHLVGLGDNTAGPGQVAGQRRPQLDTAPGARVVEGVGRAVPQHRPDGPRPVARREHRQVGCPGAQVDPGRCRCRHRGRRRGRGHGGGDDRAAARPGGQVALDDKLVVGVDHRAPGEPEVGCELARRGQRLARRQPPVADGGPQRLLDAAPAPAGHVDIEQHVHWTSRQRWNWPRQPDQSFRMVDP
jgi:hypothetical protein